MKRKLLFAALCVVSALGFEAQAQTWTASEVGAGSFYIYNVGAKGYIVAGNAWGTQASINAQGGILATLAVSDGAYTISTASTYAGKYLGADGYVDQGSYAWTFEAVEGESNVYKMKKADGNYLFANSGATSTSIGADPGTDYAKWKLVTRANRIADLEANASKENPIDATFLLANPNFDRNSTTSMWSGGVTLGGNNENYCAEKFNTTFDVYQTVTDAPKGAYALAFQGFYRYGGHGINPAGDARKAGTEVLNTKLYANDTEAPLMSILDETTAGGGSAYDGVAYPNNMSEASTAFSKGLYSTSMDFTVDVNTIKIGVKKTASVENDWTIFDNARLTYYGPVVDFTIYKANLATAVANAEALYGELPTVAETNLKAAVTQYNKDYDNVDDYIEAIAAIKTATETASEFADSYATCNSLIETANSTFVGYSNLISGVATISTDLESATDVETINGYNTQLTGALSAINAWNSLKAYAVALIPVANTNTEANTTLNGVYTAQETAVQDATLETIAEVGGTATATLKDAMVTYVGVADPTQGNRFDCTFMIDVPDMTDLWDGTWWVTPTGWATEQNGGNFQVMQNNDADAEDGIHKVFTEYYFLENNATWGNNKFNVYTSVANMPAGTYTMNCYAFAKEQNYSSGNPVPAVYFYANDTQGSLINSSRLTEQSISFINESTQDVKIGLKPLTGNTYNWMGIGYVKLYKEYTDNTTYAISTGEVANATVAVTVDGEAATEVKALKTVTLTYTPEEGYDVTSVTASYNDGENDVNLDVANPETNVYTFQMPAYDVTVTSVVTVNKSALETALATANAIDRTSNVGTGVFQIPVAAANSFATAIEAAQSVYDNASATASEVSAAATALDEAVTAFNNAELNAPDVDTKYYLTVATSGHAKEGNAVVIASGTTGDNNPTGYVMNANFAPNANLAQAVTFTQVSGNTYNISFETAEGTVYLTYGSLNGSAAEWKNSQIQATTDAEKKGEFLIAATATDNVFNIINTVTGTSVDCQDGGNIYTQGGNTGFSVSEASQASITINTTAAGWGTVILPFAQALPEGVKAYTCAEVSGQTLTLVPADAIEANKPYIIEGAWDATVEGWGIAGATSYTEGLLTGTYETMAAIDGTYILQKQGEKVGFYEVDTDKATPNVPANRAYLTVPAGAKARAFFFDGEATAIDAVAAIAAGEIEAIYTAGGVKVESLQKGLNIVVLKGGKTQKVFVK